MFADKVFRALLDRESDGIECYHSPDALVKSILFSKEFFEAHAPYLRKRKLADDEVLRERIEISRRKVTIGKDYIIDLVDLQGDEFIRGVYRLFLDREPDAEGFELYKRVLLETGKGTVIRAIVSSKEAVARARDVVVLNEAYAYISEMP